MLQSARKTAVFKARIGAVTLTRTAIQASAKAKVAGHECGNVLPT